MVKLKLLQNDQGKKLETKTISTELKKTNIWQIGIKGLNWRQSKLI